MSVRVLEGDCREVLRSLPDASVQCCVTSPPYWGLRDYGVDGQLGLERTPDEYVARMVEVFRDVRRVLRDDGTLWLNLGDSYGGDRGNKTPAPDNKHLALGAGSPSARSRDFDFRKQLVGIPWRVAFALQQPYYTGRIRDERDRIWLAAMLDAEGCMFIQKRKAGQHNGQGYYRQNDNYGPGVEISNTSLAVVERIAALVGKGSICSQGPEENARRKQTIYRWNLRTTECVEFVRELYPYIVAKQQQARILCGCPSSGEKAEAAHEALKSLHRTGTASVDFPAPRSMYEPGFYLRSDIIWNKCNPMPESVTDRPTKSHEYLFLLTKSERYLYDAAAVAEPAQDWSDGGPGEGILETHHYGANNGGNGGLSALARKYKNGAASLTRNRRSVWTIPTTPFPGAHFATFPPKLIEPCVLAGSQKGDTVLDPFFGAGTTGLVADRLGRDCIGIELNPEYAQMARERITNDNPLFTDVA